MASCVLMRGHLSSKGLRPWEVSGNGIFEMTVASTMQVAEQSSKEGQHRLMPSCFPSDLWRQLYSCASSVHFGLTGPSSGGATWMWAVFWPSMYVSKCRELRVQDLGVPSAPGQLALSFLAQSRQPNLGFLRRGCRVNGNDANKHAITEGTTPSLVLAVLEHSCLCHSHQASPAVARIDCVRCDGFKDPHSGHPPIHDNSFLVVSRSPRLCQGTEVRG